MADFKEDKFRALAYRIVNGEIGQFTYCLENDQVYYYDKGYWRSLRELEFLSLIENGLLDDNKNKIVTKFPVERREKIIKNYKILSFKRLEEFNRSHLLNFQNTMFDPITIDTTEHQPEYLSTIRIPYRYDPGADCSLWLKTIDEIFENDKIKIDMLQEFFGQCLTRDVKQEKGLLLLGQSRSGKSTILNTLHYLVGNDNVSTVPLKYILNPVYTSMMIHKLINFDKDVSKKAQDFEEDFKKIITGEEITSNDKYDDPFNFKPFCKMVLSANEFPRITDHSSAFYNRLILIPCDRVFTPEEQNRNLREELLKELPGVLNWSIEGLKRLTNRGFFEEVDFMGEALEELRIENNPVEAFFRDNIVADVSGEYYIEKGEVYNKYVAWCRENGNQFMSSINFGRTIYQKYSKFTPKKSQHNNGKRIWRNLRYVGINEPAKQPINWSD